jgi:hypothetical protein
MPEETAPTAPHRRLRRTGGALLTVLVALAGAIALLLWFEGRDSSQVRPSATAATAAGPGTLLPDEGDARLRPGQRPAHPYATDPPASGPHVPIAVRTDAAGTRLSDDELLRALELGDVVVLYGGARPPAALSALANRLAGLFDPALAAAGQAVVLGARPGTHGLIALAWRHELRVPTAGDPRLEPFASYWLGRGAGG